MKIYQQGTNIVVDVEDVNKELQYIPIHNSKFVFIGNSVKIYDHTDEDETSFTSVITDLKDEAGVAIGNKAQTAAYLSKFIGSPNLAQKNIILHQELSNPSNVVFSDFKRLSFVCDGSIDVTINGVTINYPKNFSGTKIVGEDLIADLQSANSVTFNGTGDVLITQQK